MVETDKPIFDLSEIANLDKPSMGHYVCITPEKPPGEEEGDNKAEAVNYTGKPGVASSIYYSLFIQLGKWDWTVKKADEWIEVSPTHKEYYDRTIATKQMLESTIKTGLSSAAQAVADYELMYHDLRKYREILTYFNNKDEHSLKAMFVDYVDIHTDMPGQPVSMRSIAPRWPTIIADFVKLEDEDDTPEKIQKKLNLSRAEAVILVTKNKLFKNWKKTFQSVAKERYEMLKGMVAGRKKTINEYKEWLKPYIARFKMTKLGSERSAIRKTALEAFADITGISTFSNNIRVFAWKVLRTAEFRKPPSEIKEGKGKLNFAVNPYDKYVRDELILKRLADIYPWLRNPKTYCSKCNEFFDPDLEVCPKCGTFNVEQKTEADKIVMKTILPMWKRENGLDPYELYYLFLDFNVFRVGTRLPSGELEDITFNIKTAVISQNILLLKLLELECRSKELERYIDEMIGVRGEEGDISEIVKREFPELYPKEELTESQKYILGIRKTIGAYTGVFHNVKVPKVGAFSFFQPGSYEKHFRERISKQYSTVAGANFVGVVDFLKMKMGVE